MSDRDGASTTDDQRLAEARALVWRCLDGVASESEAAELSALVIRDPEIAGELARAALLERNMEVAARVDAVEIPVPRAQPAPAGRGTAWAVAMGVAAVAAALVLGWYLRSSGPDARRGHGQGPARTTTARTTITSPSSGGFAGSAASTASAASAASRSVHFADGSSAYLRDEHSVLETRVASAQAIEVALAQGSARFEVVHLPGRRFRVWVAAGTYAEVVGTVFSIERLPAAVRVSVERGAVRVVSPRSETPISAGSTEVIALESPRPRDTASERPAPERIRPHAVETRDGKVAPEDEVAALLRASADARRAGRPAEAAARLQRLLDRHARDPRAAYAAFMLGRVLLEELARPGAAALAFARVEALDPRTPLVEDALAREVESRARAGDSALAQQRGHLYLERYPHGARADEVRRYGQMK